MSPENDINNNVNVNIFSEGSESVHHYYYSISPLHKAILIGDINEIISLFNIDNVDTVDQYMTPPLFYAVLCQRFEIVQYLLSLGADTKKTTGFGISIEELAVKLGISLIFPAP